MNLEILYFENMAEVAQSSVKQKPPRCSPLKKEKFIHTSSLLIFFTIF